jgi:hypothetical protein
MKSRLQSGGSSVTKKAPPAKPFTPDEFRIHVLQLLDRLDDPDMSQLSLRELHEIADSLQLDTLPIFIQCLSIEKTFRTVIARSSLCRLIGIVVSLYRLDVAPYAESLVETVTRRLRDGERDVREAVAETFGQIVRHVLEKGAPLSLVLKPLFLSLQEKSRDTQLSAAFALSKALSESEDRALQDLPRLSTTIFRQYHLPTCMAKGTKRQD